MHAARRLSARNTHVYAEDTKRQKTPHAHPRQKNRHNSHSNTATKTRGKGKRATQQTGPTTTEEQQKQQQSEEEKGRRPERKETRKSLSRPPGPLQTTQGQDRRTDLDPGVGMQWAGGFRYSWRRTETPRKEPQGTLNELKKLPPT